MVRNWFKAAIGVMALTAFPGFSQAQSNGSGAKLGSKDNPIPATSVGTPVSNTKSNGKVGKRGSKTNPITGRTHPRNSN